MTDKQKRFCDEYLKDMNATQAAIRAGYSPKTARAIGQENLTKLDIKTYIETEMQELHTKSIADAQEIQEYLTSVLRGEETDAALIYTAQGHQEKTEVPISNKDRLKAAELLGKAHGIFSDRINIDLEPVQIINDVKE